MDLRIRVPSNRDSSNGPEILAVTWALTSIALAVVILKIWTRIKLIRHTGPEDVLTAIAVVFVLIYSGLITASVQAGLGRHLVFLAPEAIMRSVRLAIISNPFVILASALPNVSVAIALNRILIPVRWQASILLGIPIIQCLLALVCSILTFTYCIPPSHLWDLTVKAKCMPTDAIVAVMYFNGAVSAFTDVFLALVPIAALWKLQMKLKKKVGVCLLMSTTAIAAIAATIRTTYIPDPKLTLDFPHAIHSLMNWALVEADSIIIAACIPSLRPFVVSVGHSIGNRGRTLIPAGYYHAHSRRQRPRTMVPRESGIGNPELRRPDRTYHECCRGSISICTHNKALTSADITPPSTSIASPSLESMEKEEEVTSHV